MHLFKQLTIITLIVSGYSTSILAAEKKESPTLNAEQVANMSCSMAAEQLKAKIELNQQLGSAYLQTYQTLGDVYSTWGEKLTHEKDSDKISAIGTYFLSSADTTKSALLQSSKVVEELNLETNLLMGRVIGCLNK